MEVSALKVKVPLKLPSAFELAELEDEEDPWAAEEQAQAQAQTQAPTPKECREREKEGVAWWQWPLQAQKQELGRILRFIRLFQGMSHETLANALGVEKSTVAAWEKRAGFHSDELRKLADIFQVDPVVFFEPSRLLEGYDDSYLHDNIRLLRFYLGLSQVELARRLNVSNRKVSLWESRGKIDPLDLPKIARVLGVTLEELMHPVLYLQRIEGKIEGKMAGH